MKKYINKSKLIVYSLVCVFIFMINSFVVNAFFNDGKGNNVIVEDLSDSKENDVYSQVDMIDDSDDSGITTKIYRSTDQSSKLLEENFSKDTAIDIDLINKEEFIKHRNGINRKLFTINNRKNKLVKSKQDNNFLPIIAIFLMFLLLSIIFNFIKKKKV